MIELGRRLQAIDDIVEKDREITALEIWFKHEYPMRLANAARYKYLGLPSEETRYDIELLAYEKENRLRELKGLEKLPPLKIKKII